MRDAFAALNYQPLSRPTSHDSLFAMYLAHVAATLEGEADGVTVASSAMVRGLGTLGHRVDFLSLQGGVQSFGENVTHLEFRQEGRQTPILRSLGLAKGLRRSLFSIAECADLIHFHGLWRMPQIYAAQASYAERKPLVCSPHGMLNAAAMRFSYWQKRAFWVAVLQRALSRVTCFHATSLGEYSDIRSAGFLQPVAIIPLGVRALPLSADKATAPDRRRLLFLGRIHPTKGLDLLLEVWRDLASRHPAWDLRIVGPADDPAYLAKLQVEISRTSIPRVAFAGPKIGDEKESEYEVAELFILPSFGENFGLAVAESLASGTPVITTTETPWSGLQDKGCGWWVPATGPELTKALDDALSRPPKTLSSMGLIGRNWMSNSFSWQHRVLELASVYAWLCRAGERPPQVIWD